MKGRKQTLTLSPPHKRINTAKDEFTSDMLFGLMRDKCFDIP
jgi:hypothetical protein